MCKEYRCIFPLIISVILGIIIGALFYTGTLVTTVILIPIIFAIVFVSVTLVLLFVVAVFATKKEAKDCICKYGQCVIVGGVGTLVTGFLALTFLASLVAKSVVVAFLIGIGGLFFIFNFLSFVGLFYCLIIGDCLRDEDGCKFEKDYDKYYK